MYENDASSRTEVFCKKVFLKILQNSQENTCTGISYNKVAGLQVATLLKKRFWQRFLPEKSAKLLENSEENLRTAASKVKNKRSLSSVNFKHWSLKFF